MSKKNKKAAAATEKQQQNAAESRRRFLRQFDRVMRKAETALDSFNQLDEDLEDLIEEVSAQFGTENQLFDEVDMARAGVITDMNRLITFIRTADNSRQSVEAKK